MSISCFSVPASERSSVIQAREAFLKKNLPITTSLALEMKAETKSMTSVERSEYFKSKRVIGRMEEALAELESADTEKLNKMLPQAL